MTDAILSVAIDPAGAQSGAAVAVRSLTDIRQSARQLVETIGQTGRDMGRHTGDMASRIQGDMQRAARQMAEVQRVVSLASAAFGAFAGVIGIQVVRGLGDLTAAAIRSADAWGTLRNRVNAAAGEVGDGERVFVQLRKSAIDMGASLSASIDQFQRLAFSAGTLGATNPQIVEFTALVQKLGAISGASGDEMARGMVQLSQGLSQGVLRGQDLRSVIEQLPALADRIARGLGVTMGQLRQMGEAGELTSRQVFDSVLKQAPEIERVYNATGRSLARAVDGFQTAWGAALDNLNQRLGLTRALAAAIAALTPTPSDRTNPQYTDIERWHQAMRQPGGIRMGLSEYTAWRRAMEGELELHRIASERHGTTTRERDAAVALGKTTLKEIDETGQKIVELTKHADALQRALEFDPANAERYAAGLAQISHQLTLMVAPAEKLARETDKALALAGLTGLRRTEAQARNVADEIFSADVGGHVRGSRAIYFKSLEPELQRLAREAAEQRAIAGAVPFGPEAMRQARVQGQIAAYRDQHFAGAGGPDVDAAVSAYGSRINAVSAGERGIALTTRQHDLEKAARDAEKIAEASGRGAAAARAMRLELAAQAEAIAFAREGTEEYAKVYADAFGRLERRDFADRRTASQERQDAMHAELELLERTRALQFAKPADREAELAYLRTASELRRQGLTDADGMIEREATLAATVAKTKSAYEESARVASDYARTIAGGFEQAVFSANSFRDGLYGIARALERVTFNNLITKPFERGLGRLFDNILPFADGGIMTEFGPVPLRKYDGGGIARGPQLAMFGEGSVPEAYVPVPTGKIPVELRGASGPNVTINVAMNFDDGAGGGGVSPETIARAGNEVAERIRTEVLYVLRDQMRDGGMLNS